MEEYSKIKIDMSDMNFASQIPNIIPVTISGPE